MYFVIGSLYFFNSHTRRSIYETIIRTVTKLYSAVYIIYENLILLYRISIRAIKFLRILALLVLRWPTCIFSCLYAACSFLLILYTYTYIYIYILLCHIPLNNCYDSPLFYYYLAQLSLCSCMVTNIFSTEFTSLFSRRSFFSLSHPTLFSCNFSPTCLHTCLNWGIFSSQPRFETSIIQSPTQSPDQIINHYYPPVCHYTNQCCQSL